MSIRKYIFLFCFSISGSTCLYFFFGHLIIISKNDQDILMTNGLEQHPEEFKNQRVEVFTSSSKGVFFSKMSRGNDSLGNENSKVLQRPSQPSVIELIDLSQITSRAYIENNNRSYDENSGHNEKERNKKKEKWIQEQQEKRPKHYRFHLEFYARGQANLIRAGRYTGKVSSSRKINGQFLYVIYMNGIHSHIGTFIDPTIARSIRLESRVSTSIQLLNGTTVLSAPSSALNDSSYIEFYRLDPHIPHDTLLSLGNVDSIIERSSFHSSMHLGGLLPQ